MIERTFEAGWFVRQLKEALTAGSSSHVEITASLNEYFLLPSEESGDRQLRAAFTSQQSEPETRLASTDDA